MNGILVVNKESGYTSRDVVNILNKELGTKKIGHTGTLDPIATGVLVVCVGQYTKLVDKITAYDKEYIATIQLGVETDTLDRTGKILKENSEISVDNQVLINTLNSFLGKSLQEVPIYSAVKVNGKKLYDYARNQEEIELPKREIEIKEIELLESEKGFITFRTVVSKGTYIRSLIRDICKKLDILGTMYALERTRQGQFSVNESFPLEYYSQFSRVYSILFSEIILRLRHRAAFEINSRNAFPQIAGKFIVEAPGAIAQFLQRQTLASTLAYQHHLVSQRRVRDVGHIDHKLIHTDPAADRCLFSMNQHPSLVGKTSGIAVPIAHRNGCNLRWTRHRIGRSIADLPPWGQLLQKDDPAF